MTYETPLKGNYNLIHKHKVVYKSVLMVTAVVLISRDRPDFATLPIGLDSVSLYLCLSVCLTLFAGFFSKDLCSIDKNKKSVLMSRLRKLSKSSV